VNEGEDKGAGPQVLFQENCTEPSNRAIGARVNIIEDLLQQGINSELLK
jgi:hypothetical protein